MAIFKIFKPLYTVTEIKNKILYLLDKKTLNNAYQGGVYCDYSTSPLGVISRGLNAATYDAEGQAREIKLYHDLFGGSGKILGYHMMLDLNCEFDPANTAIIGSIINEFWSREYVSWIQGLHLYEGGSIYWPHLHMVVSTRVMDGPRRGQLLKMDKALIARFNQHVNDTLKLYGVSGIPCRKVGKIGWTA